jgi:hypothetical protein
VQLVESQQDAQSNLFTEKKSIGWGKVNVQCNALIQSMQAHAMTYKSKTSASGRLEGPDDGYFVAKITRKVFSS